MLLTALETPKVKKMGPVITNERGKREWLYIIDRVGQERAQQAISELGNRKAYPLNVAKVLKLDLPDEQYLPELDGVKERRLKNGKKSIADIKNILNQ